MAARESEARVFGPASFGSTLMEWLRTSATEIFAHKLRSPLTLVGIVLGTTSLVVMVSVIGGAAKAIKSGFDDLGFDGVMFAAPSTPEDRIERKKQGYSRGLRSSDVDVINDGRDLIENAAPLAATRAPRAHEWTRLQRRHRRRHARIRADPRPGRFGRPILHSFRR